MKKRFTLLSTALLMGTSLSVFAEQASSVDKAEWKEGYYYQLESKRLLFSCRWSCIRLCYSKKNYCRIKGFVGFNIVANNKAYNFWRNCLSIPK